MGTPQVAVPALKSLHEDPRFNIIAVVTQPDKKVGRKQLLYPSAVKDWALKHDITVLQPPSLKENHEFTSLLEGLHPDLFVVTAYGQILPEEILQIPKFGSINIHFSLLPKYRGASPVESAILNGDPETGITYQLIVKKLDAGPIVHLEKMIIDNRDTTTELKEKLAKITGIVTAPTLADYVNGILKPIPQEEDKVTYCHKITKEDGLIDPFTMSAAEICRKVRAYDPWPGCFLNLNSKRLKILEASCSVNLPPLESGVMGIFQKNHLAIGTPEGTFELIKVQLEGKKAMNIQDFLSGNLNVLKNELAKDR